MNKYMGFYELRSLSIPTVPWQEFDTSTVLDDRFLWTVRVAVEYGNDLSLPRAVGVNSIDAYNKGVEFLRQYGEQGLVIYYPFFLADKSGVLDINYDRIIIEGVRGDLWNFVTHGFKDSTIVVKGGTQVHQGDGGFLSKREVDEILHYASIVKGEYRNTISEGKSILMEWSYAYDADINKRPIGERYLVFYEMRTVD